MRGHISLLLLLFMMTAMISLALSHEEGDCVSHDPHDIESSCGSGEPSPVNTTTKTTTTTTTTTTNDKEDFAEGVRLPSTDSPTRPRLGQKTMHHIFETLSLYTDRIQLPVKGKIPDYVEGTLLRNGFGKFEHGEVKFNFLFDTLSMLYRYKIKGGKVTFSNKLLRSEYLKETEKLGTLAPYKTFGGTDPCQTLFERLTAHFRTVHDNMNVAIWKSGERFYAVSDMPHALEFDPVTLNTGGQLPYNDSILEWKKIGVLGSAHPRVALDGSGDTISYVGQVDPLNLYHKYSVYRLAPGSTERKILTEIPRSHVSYVHSFALSKNYLVFVEFPQVWDFTVLAIPFSSGTLSRALNWRPEFGTHYTVINIATGEIVNEIHDKENNFFAYHHVNAFEEDGYVFFDIVAYDDGNHMKTFYLDKLRNAQPDYFPCGRLRRYKVPLKAGEGVTFEFKSRACLDLPRFNDKMAGKKLRYVYGVGEYAPGDWWNCLIKVDMENPSSEALTWAIDEHFPSEPSFIPNPAGTKEDDGVLISTVTVGTTGKSFLLVLDACTFEEVARAEVPFHIPFNSHGEFYANL